MITYEEALEIVRHEFPNFPIRTVFEFNNEYHFSVSSGKTFIPDDIACTLVTVSMTDGKFGYESVGDLLFKFRSKEEIDRYKKASNNIRPVDITSEQFEELQNLV